MDLMARCAHNRISECNADNYLEYIFSNDRDKVSEGLLYHFQNIITRIFINGGGGDKNALEEMVERERKRIGLVHFSKLKPIERENAVAYVRADIDTVVAVKPSLSKRFKYYFIPLISLHHPNLLRLRNLVKSECPDCRVTNGEKVTNSLTCISMERLSRMRAALRPTQTR